MSDMERRPPGGWQTGSPFRRYARARLVDPTAPPDPSPDCYTVTRQPDGVFRVRHYPDAETDRPCCTILVTRREGESDIEALHRSYLLSEKHHGRLNG